MCFFFNDTATTEIYTLSLHDALPISDAAEDGAAGAPQRARRAAACRVPGAGSETPRSLRGPRSRAARRDRKSTRLNSSHSQISYAVFCLKKKKNKNNNRPAHNLQRIP